MCFVKLLATAVTSAFHIFHMKSKTYVAKSMYLSANLSAKENDHFTTMPFLVKFR